MIVDREHGFRTTPRSYGKVEISAAHARRVMFPNVLATKPIPALDLFEDLFHFKLDLPDGNLWLDSAVSHLPAGLEGMATYDADSRKALITLDEKIYIAIANGKARAVFCLCHELGHICLHTQKLIELAQIPHRVAAMNRGTVARHPVYEDTEWQANAFAAAFQIPAEGLAMLEKTLGWIDAPMVQAVYRVSFDCARIRLDVYRKYFGHLADRV